MNNSPSSSWDPAVLRKYSTTGHFRLLNQVRSELRAQPLVRPGEGESVAEVNRSRALTRAIESRAPGGGRSRRGTAAGRSGETRVPAPLPVPESTPLPEPVTGDDADESAFSLSFRDRLSAVDMR